MEELELEEEEEDTAAAAATAAAFEEPEEQWSGEEPEQGPQAELLEQAEVLGEAQAEPGLQAATEAEAVSATPEESNGRSDEAGWEERPKEGVSSPSAISLHAFSLSDPKVQQFSSNLSECEGMLQTLQTLQMLQRLQNKPLLKLQGNTGLLVICFRGKSFPCYFFLLHSLLPLLLLFFSSSTLNRYF